ncbi:hypothetical protein [Citrobacter farmeri]|uniref:hypothetical protein n=1 Tax=Citrobacter farmeri TaxID=67824 RepID=UPI00189CCD6B|nr:hypothetical protein [Citrobacter farmeri]EHK0947748.1 hypothetical protein [Citrobacter farmeri]EKU0081749.1 hypothetical protein [Citrobacter farmeri]EKX4543093.1 hypothetical protein [Citrobacter farmeri]MBJ9163102.1 hypothetical protein [Citrobacter farmeri]MDB2164073.1 hypothetical protein [Citrobacter farmeri]
MTSQKSWFSEANTKTIVSTIFSPSKEQRSTINYFYQNKKPQRQIKIVLNATDMDRFGLMIQACLIAETCNKRKYGFFLGNIPGLINEFYSVGTGLILPG